MYRILRLIQAVKTHQHVSPLAMITATATTVTTKMLPSTGTDLLCVDRRGSCAFVFALSSGASAAAAAPSPLRQYRDWIVRNCEIPSRRRMGLPLLPAT